MGTPNNTKLSEAVDTVKSWTPWRQEPMKVSRDFWMPDQSCKVCYDCDSQFCYDCDSQFRIFNRRHHCRLCGRIFYSKCTEHSVPAPSDDPCSGWEDWGWIRVCNYCFERWEHGSEKIDNVMTAAGPEINPSPSATSLVGNESSYTCSSDRSDDSSMCSTEPHQCSGGPGPRHPAQMEDICAVKHVMIPGKSRRIDTRDSVSNQSLFSSRSGDQDDDCHICKSHSETSHLCPNISYDDINSSKIDHVYEQCEEHLHKEITEPTCIISPWLPESETHKLEGTTEHRAEADKRNNAVDHGPSPSNSSNDKDGSLLDYGNNDLLWLPPEPEDEEEGREAALLSDDDDSGGEGGRGEWGYLRMNSFSGKEFRTRN